LIGQIVSFFDGNGGTLMQLVPDDINLGIINMAAGIKVIE